MAELKNYHTVTCLRANDLSLYQRCLHYFQKDHQDRESVDKFLREVERSTLPEDIKEDLGNNTLCFIKGIDELVIQRGSDLKKVVIYYDQISINSINKLKQWQKS